MRILLVKTSSLGDVVHNLPVVTDLRAHLPGATMDWVVEEAFADIPKLHFGVGKVIPVALRRWRKSLFASSTWREMRDFRRRLRAEAYDVVLDTQGLVKSAVITWQARLIPNGRRCGYAAEVAREPLAARAYDNGYVIPRNIHAVERNRWLAAAAFDYIADTPLDYGIAAQPLQATWLPDRPIAILLTGASRADKLWPEVDWVRTGQWLAQRGLACVLPAGSTAERGRAQRLAAQIPGGLLAPSLSVAELAGLFSRARLAIGLDTGLTHLAAALGKPAIALFTGSDPTLTGLQAVTAIRNLGQRGLPPSADAVIAAASALG